VADESSTLWMAWFDAAEGVRFASGGDGAAPSPIDTAPDTANGATPSVAVTPDGTTAYLAWYDTVNQDLLVGAYGDVQGLAIAVPSPEPGPPEGQPTQPPGQECAPVEDGVVKITAQGLAFDTGCIEAPAGEAFQVEFVNEDDGIPHNVAIYPSAEEVSPDAALMQGETFNGVDTRTYDVPALDAGGYYFQCDVHPNMNGTVNVVEAGGGGGPTGATGAEGGGGGGALTVVAQNIAFDTDTIELPADTATTITFQNQDPPDVLHNIAIYSDDSLSEVLFAGDVIPGGDTIEYEIDPLPAGEYYFRCDVHPNMNGTVVVG
jgi:plastocyanin